MLDWLRDHDLEVIFFTVCPALFLLGLNVGVAFFGSHAGLGWTFGAVAFILLIPSLILLVPETISATKAWRRSS